MAKVDVKCPVCEHAAPVKKHGCAKSGHQRYRCQSCNRPFPLDYAYHACQPGMKGHIVDLAVNNAGIRDTARALHISINAVVRTLKKLSPWSVTTLPLDNLQIQLICDVDEMGVVYWQQKTPALVIVRMGATVETDYRPYFRFMKQENAV